MMDIKRINKKVEDILKGAEYLGCGASKEAFKKDNIVYKVPRGRSILQDSEFLPELQFPSEIDDVNEFLSIVCDWEEAMVWPLGQFAIELIVWNKLLQLEKEGIDISEFARINDYYITSDNVLVIEQEVADCKSSKDIWYPLDDDWDKLYAEVEALDPILEERFNISLRDVREGNCGYTEDGVLKLFDFGISTTTQLDSYGSYSDYGNESSEYYSDDEGSY